MTLKPLVHVSLETFVKQLYVEGNCNIFLQGKISFKNLKRVAKELGENLTDEELQVWTAIIFNN